MKASLLCLLTFGLGALLASCTISGGNGGDTRTPPAEVPPTPPAGPEENPPKEEPLAPEPPALPEKEMVLKVDVQPDELPPLTQKVALEIVSEKTEQKKLEVPLEVTVTGPEKVKKTLELEVNVVTPEKLKIPVSLRATDDAVDRCTCDCCNPDRKSRGESGTKLPKETTHDEPPREPERPVLGYSLLFGVIVVGGLAGGWLRWLETKKRRSRIEAELAKLNRARAVPEPTEKAAPPPSDPQDPFSLRRQALEQEQESLDRARMGDLAWGLLGSLLVPAVLAVGSNALLNEVKAGSAIHVAALLGFCIVAASLGAEFLARLQHLVRTGKWADREGGEQASLGSPPPASSSGQTPPSAPPT